MCNREEPGSFDCSCFVSGDSQSLRPEMEISAAVDDSPRVKFLCSFGGSILPRPLDGRLRYVGGETRIMNVPRDISYHDLLVRVRELFDGVSVIKYQQPDEDLDALVSVVNDEDVMNMMEEYDKFIANGDGLTWLRIFLFSQCPDQDVASMGPHYDADDRKAERRYIDAINNLIDVKSTSPPDMSEHYFGHLSIDGGIPNQVNLSHLTIPSHGQRYGEMDTPRSPALFSPGCLAANDPHEFSPPPSPARFYHEAGDVSDKILADYIQHTGGHQLHQHDLHCPSTAESYVWIPPGAVLQEKSGFPANLGHSHNMVEGNNLCEHCHMSFQRNHCLMPDAHFHDTRWKHGLPYLEQSNINEYVGNFPNLCTGCFGNKDPYMPNRDLKMGHGIYVKEHNEQHPMLNDSHNCERGWAIRNNNITLRVEDMRMHQIGTGRTSEQYIDGNMMNATHGNISDKQSFPYNCINHNDSHYIQYGANIGNEVFAPQHITGAIPGANVLGFEDAAIRYQNQPSAYGADSPYQGLNNLHLAQSLWRNRRVPVHPGTSYELASSMIMNGPDPLTRYKQEGSPRFPYVLVDNEIPNALSSQNNCHNKLVSFEEFPAADHEYQCDTRTNPNSSDQDVIPPLASVYPGLHVKVPSKEIPLMPSPSYQIDKESAITNATEAPKPALQMQATSKNNMTLEGQEKQHMISNEPDVYITLSPKHKLLEVSIKELQLSEVEEDTNKYLDAHSNVAHGDEDMLGENLNFLPELIASVKKAVLEGAEEVVAMSQSNSGLDSTPGKKESLCGHKPKDVNADVQADLTRNSELPMTAEHGDLAKELQNQNANLDVQADLEGNSENEKLCKIEPTTAEAEALSKGLQTIRNDDLEEIRQLGSGTFGSVYYGKWRGSDVAIKRIKASCFAGKPSERERLIADFWKEALIMSCLHHPNIVSFYGVVRDGPDGSLATVTEFMVNGSLKQFLQKKDRTIDRRKRLIIAMDVAFGMEYLHEKNIVHFDLKCENLLVNMRDPHRPVCKIGDLGLSKVKQHTLVSGGLRGTLPWMAPELLSGKSNMVSEKIDVYSYGIVMWELLTGEDPYADMRCASIIGGIVNNSIRPKIPIWCDPEWKSLMETCWSSDPALRPSFSETSQTLRKMAAAINLK